MSKVTNKNPFGSADEETLIVIGVAAIMLHAMYGDADARRTWATDAKIVDRSFDVARLFVDRSFDVARLFVDRAKIEHARAQK